MITTYLGFFSLGLEIDGFVVATFHAILIGSGQRRVSNNVGDDQSQFAKLEIQITYITLLFNNTVHES